MWRMICDTKPGRQFEAGRLLRESVKVSFDRHDIEIPFPHRVMIQAEPAASAT